MRGKANTIPIGSTFGKLTTISETWTVRSNARAGKPVRYRRWVEVECVCGSKFPVRTESLLLNHTKSCGCFKHEIHRVIAGGKKCKFCGLENCPAVVTGLGADCTTANSFLSGIAARKAKVGA